MKYLNFFLLLLLPLSVLAQFQSNDEGLLYYEEVVQADSLSKQEIHSKVNEWFSVSFNDSNSVIKMNTESKIIGNGNSSFSVQFNMSQIPYRLEYSITVDFKDERYKILINNIYSKANGFESPIAKTEMSYKEWLSAYKKQIEEMDPDTKKLIEKQLSKEKVMRQTYQASVDVQKKVYNQAVYEITNIVESLKSHVRSNQNNDW